MWNVHIYLTLTMAEWYTRVFQWGVWQHIAAIMATFSWESKPGSAMMMDTGLVKLQSVNVRSLYTSTENMSY